MPKPFWTGVLMLFTSWRVSRALGQGVLRSWDKQSEHQISQSGEKYLPLKSDSCSPGGCLISGLGHCGVTEAHKPFFRLVQKIARSEIFLHLSVTPLSSLEQYREKMIKNRSEWLAGSASFSGALRRAAAPWRSAGRGCHLESSGATAPHPGTFWGQTPAWGRWIMVINKCICSWANGCSGSRCVCCSPGCSKVNIIAGS